MLCNNVFSGSGLFFDISATGTPGNLSITLCLNGKGPLSCQDYNVSALAFNIATTIPNHAYPSAEIKINTPGYSIGNLGVDCTLYSPTGYCLFSVSDTTPKTLTVVISGPLSIFPTLLPNATLNTVYGQTLIAIGGVAPYTYTISGGKLPPGLLLNSTTGMISGIPTSDGTYNFTVTATDSNASVHKTGSKAYSVVVSGSLILNPQILPPGLLNTTYNATITASGGVGFYIFSVTSGSLPPGLTLNPNGTLSGTPTSNGTYPVTITATDAHSSDTGSKAYTIVVFAPFAYVSNNNGNTVSICSVNLNGSLGTCTTDSDATFNAPGEIAFNTTNKLAYITANSGNAISVCPVNSNGSLGTCTSDSDATFNAPAGIIVNRANTFAYVTNRNNNTVSVCPINSNGSLGICSADPDSTFNFPAGLTLNSANTQAYIANQGNSTVSVCPINSNGSLGTCSPFSDPTFDLTSLIALNPTNTFIYVTNANNNTVSICPVNPSGLLSPCSAFNDPTFFVPLGITINSTNTLAYITNGFNNTVSVCTVNLNGSLGTCNADPDVSFNFPVSIWPNQYKMITYNRSQKVHQ